MRHAGPQILSVFLRGRISENRANVLQQQQTRFKNSLLPDEANTLMPFLTFWKRHT